MLLENSFFVLLKRVSWVLLIVLTYAPANGNPQDKRPRLTRPRKPSPVVATPTPRFLSAHLLLRRTSVVVVTKSGIPSFHVSAVLRNVESYKVSDVRVFLRGRGGILLPMRGARSIPPRSEVVFYTVARELFDPKVGVSCVSTCKECGNRPIP